MSHRTIREGTPVMLKNATVLDENGEPWTHGAGPFTVARVLHTKGYRMPWLRLYRGKGSAAEELPGWFRAKELRALNAREARAFYGLRD